MSFFVGTSMQLFSPKERFFAEDFFRFGNGCDFLVGAISWFTRLISQIWRILYRCSWRERVCSDNNLPFRSPK